MQAPTLSKPHSAYYEILLSINEHAQALGDLYRDISHFIIVIVVLTEYCLKESPPILGRPIDNLLILSPL